jgi:hypothetical protein
MQYDHYAVERSDFLLFMGKKFELIKIKGNINTGPRKKLLGTDQSITARIVLSNKSVQGLIQHDTCHVLNGI